MKENLKKLFENYAKAFDALDFKTQAESFTDAFIMAGPQGAVSQSRAEFLANAEQAVSYYERVGMNSAKMLSAREESISHDYSIVTVHWGVTFRKTGNLLVEFDVSYIVHSSLHDPKIILAISHEDEQEAMKKLDVLKDN